MSAKKLENHSFLHSFLVKKESGVGVLRARKYPQDTGEWLPNDGIKLLQDKVDFSEVGVSELRIEKLNLDAVFSGLYTKYIPQLPENEQKEVTLSWERLKNTLENLPRRSSNLTKMKLLELPKQVVVSESILPAYLEQFQSVEVRELQGAKHIEDPPMSSFELEVKPKMDVAIYTQVKSTRPWLGRVISIMPGGKEFIVHWFKRMTRSLSFSASVVNGAAFTSALSTDSVMMWNFSDNQTEDSFEVSQEWYNKILKEYSEHDICYT